jgi:hypothetical protein
MVLLPSYTDLMTALNNDVAAVSVLSLFLWGAVRAIVRGPTLLHLAWIAFAVILCVLTKDTTAVAVLLTPLALALAWLRRTPPWWAWTALLAVVVLFALLVLDWGDAALWFRETPQRAPTSRRIEEAPEGVRAFALEFASGVERDAAVPTPMLLQPLPKEDVEAIRGITVTLGAWMWASQPASVRTPILNDGIQRVARTVDVDPIPAFHTLTTTIAPGAQSIQVILNPMPDWGARKLDASSSEPSARIVYYDEIVLAEDIQSGINRMRNGSAEQTGPYLNPAIDEVFKRRTRRSPSQFLTSILDWQRTSRIYPRIATNLFQSFWARFGWNHIGVADNWYWALGAMTLLGVVGAGIAYARQGRMGWPTSLHRALGLLALSGLLVWANAFLRPHPLIDKPFIPVARYAYPAIIPTMLVLIGGWRMLVPRRFGRWGALAGFCVFVLLDAISIQTLFAFYYGR